MLFEESGIAPDVITERGVRSIGRGRELPGGFSPRQRRLGSGLLFTVHRPDGGTAYSFRPDKPDKPGRKYEQQSKRYGGPGNVLDVHPSERHLIGDLSVPVVYVEGIKKADAIRTTARRSGARVLVVAISGVWNFLSDGELVPDMLRIPTEGREVWIVFDSDILTNPGVQGAGVRLAEMEIGRGAKVRMAFLPDAPDGSKVGADDFLVSGKPFAELRATMRVYDPGDFELVKMSRDEKLRAAVHALWRRWWAEEWRGQGGHSDRDVAITLLAAAARNGKAHPDGLRVGMSWGELEGEARVSRRTLAKALRRLEERGFVRRDTEGREAGRSGAFVLRAGVNQYEKAPPEATGSRGDNPIGLHLRALHEAGRNMWSRPAFTPRRGIVSGTRRVRQGKQQEPRERIVRLGKVRGAIVDALIASGGSCTLAELCAVLRRKRPRDVRRRVLPMLEETGIVAVEGDGITLAADWAERLEDARRLGGELDAAELAEERRKDKSRAYRDYLAGRSKPDAHYVNVGVDGHVEDLRPADEPAEAPAQDAPVSPLAAAVRYYLEHNPRDACERPSWIANTLWALELTEGKPTPAEVRSAIEELGGDPYLRGCLDAAKGAA